MNAEDEEQWLLDHGKFIQDEHYVVENLRAIVWWSNDDRSRFRSIRKTRKDAINKLFKKVKDKLYDMSSGSYRL